MGKAVNGMYLDWLSLLKSELIDVSSLSVMSLAQSEIHHVVCFISVSILQVKRYILTLVSRQPRDTLIW